MTDLETTKAGVAGKHSFLDRYLTPWIFARLGFERVPCVSAPEALRRAPEFASVCPASPVCMTKRLR